MKLLKSLILVICALTITSTATCAFSTEDDLYSEQSLKMRIVRTAINEGLDPSFALSVAKQESAFDKDAKSYVGAIGLFQLMPQTASDLGVNPYYVDQNIKGGVRLLKSLKAQYGSSKLALAAYNAGPGAVNRYGGIPPYRETRHYVKNIMSYYHGYKKQPDPVVTYFKNRIEESAKQVDQVANKVIEPQPIAPKPQPENFFSRLIAFFMP